MSVALFPATALTAALAGLSMAAVPATLGFVTKEAALEGLLGADRIGSRPSCSWLCWRSRPSPRPLSGRFWQGRSPQARPDPPIRPSRRSTRPTCTQPPLQLSPPRRSWPLPVWCSGRCPAWSTRSWRAAARTLEPAAGSYHLHAFAGFNTALALSASALAAGVLLVAAAGPVARIQSRLRAGPSAGESFRSVLAALLRTANAVAGTVQSGSLPVYLATILLAMATVTGVILIPVAHARALGLGRVPLQALGAVAVMAGAAGVVLIQSRFAATLALGAVGYAMAVLFVAYDAPDLALTQFLVETVVVVAFVLVLRKLPEEFRSVPWRGRQVLRVVTSAAVGLVVFAFLLATGGPGPDAPPTNWWPWPRHRVVARTWST